MEWWARDGKAKWRRLGVVMWNGNVGDVEVGDME